LGLLSLPLSGNRGWILFIPIIFVHLVPTGTTVWTAV